MGPQRHITDVPAQRFDLHQRALSRLRSISPLNGGDDDRAASRSAINRTMRLFQAAQASRLLP